MNADMLVTVRCYPTASTKKTHLCPSVFIRGSIFHRRLRRHQPQINTRRYVGNRTVLLNKTGFLSIIKIFSTTVRRELPHPATNLFVSICIYPWFTLHDYLWFPSTNTSSITSLNS